MLMHRAGGDEALLAMMREMRTSGVFILAIKMQERLITGKELLQYFSLHVMKLRTRERQLLLCFSSGTPHAI